jgi:hypothetical protein
MSGHLRPLLGVMRSIFYELHGFKNGDLGLPSHCRLLTGMNTALSIEKFTHTYAIS